MATRPLSPAAALLLAALATPLAAQPVVHINGQVWDGNGGPFFGGTVYHIISNGAACCMSVPAGRTLTIHPGAMVKIDVSITVQGTLNARNATFTSWHDDTVGGDSNNNGGATAPRRGDWQRIEIGGSATFDDCLFRFAGRASSAETVWHRNGSMTMRRCVVEHGASNGITCSQLPSAISDTTIRMCDGIAIDQVALRHLPLLVDNTAADCDSGDYVRIANGNLDSTSGHLLLDHRHSLNRSGIFVLHGTTRAIDVRSGASLTIPRGTTLKFERGEANTFDNVQIQGTTAEPVVLTSLEDDQYGGDTNKDGNATGPSPGDWAGLAFRNGSDASLVDHAIVRYAGTTFSDGAGIVLNGTTASVRNTIVERSRAAGFYFRGSFNGFPSVTGCTIRNNATTPVVDIPWGSLELCRNNVASGNAGGDHFVVFPERPVVPVTVGPENYTDDVLVVVQGTLLTNGGELTLRQGTRIKFSNPSSSGFNTSLRGALRLLGTADEPIVLTSIHDDTIGGDTNQNGNATVPQPGQWGSVWIGDDRVVSDSILENVILRYPGRGNAVAITARNSRLAMRAVRIEHAMGRGMDLGLVRGDVVNPVVWNAGATAIRITGAGAFDIVHATIFRSAGFGIEETNSGYSGAVRNSIVWNNTGGNFGGSLTAGEVHHTDGGFAGVNGNILQDPLFAGAAAGDFGLTLGSPCLGIADMATALTALKDHDEASRVLDHALNGSARPDMGAYERAAFRMSTSGQPVIGTTMNFTVQGPAGISAAFVGFLDGTFFLAPLGVELAGSTIFMLTTGVPVGQAIALPIPDVPAIRGLPFGVQGVAVSLANANAGNFTNLYRGVLR